jgi:glyoxylase-like metal-dependent hydrolase (beta-lactamase superfamily II)
MNQSEDNKIIPATSIESGKGHEIKPDVYYFTNQIVNVIMLSEPGTDKWILVDTGMPKRANEIIEMAEKRFGKNTKPEYIILTHGHFDHTGNVVALVNKWNVPVYAHPLEFPYLTGRNNYPKPDPSHGGLLAKVSFIYPVKPIDISDALKALPADNSIPLLSGWRWIHTPGHTPGHISLFHSTDQLLIAGDAFVTVKQDSLYKVLIQKKEVNGPPVYLTMDWRQAKTSVEKLLDIHPSGAITGHGRYMYGDDLIKGLQQLLENFSEWEYN